MILIDGRKISNDILQSVKTEVEKLAFVPVFCDVLVGDDYASKKYVEMKAKKAESIGFKFHSANFDVSITTEDLVNEIEKINKIENMCGVIVQLPLPAHIDEQKVLDAINPDLDVDALGRVVGDKFYKGEESLCLPTALACMDILDSLHLDSSDKKIVVLGQGKLVGKPVTQILRSRGLEPETIDSDTPNQETILQNADIIISGIGKGAYIKGDMIKPGVVIIDAGTSESGAGLVGDVDLESVKDAASYVSPVPGGVGPVTIAMLFRNVLEVAKQKDAKPQ
ncbi:MAG: bifunctional 5,10-methylenetetrahydrofolate dehydrogenase/5,10-methenyltetrahydrofolate cyclohydrolase [Candidatus Pacebacteria bacterium]|nr:bifunctional 5,10-methylenetetrahydrofolate dehydrogenase/5,10-methenyltetrahydrofolate cyclohydrolase [Candidatus Paceibacterota bacterium]